MSWEMNAVCTCGAQAGKPGRRTRGTTATLAWGLPRWALQTVRFLDGEMADGEDPAEDLLAQAEWELRPKFFLNDKPVSKEEWMAFMDKFDQERKAEEAERDRHYNNFLKMWDLAILSRNDEEGGFRALANEAQRLGYDDLHEMLRDSEANRHQRRVEARAHDSL